MRIKFVIIGGGVAGLTAAVRLAELGEKPLLIEGGSYPSHKVCGEFLSPESLDLLAKWEIYPVAIPKAILCTSTHQTSFDFPHAAGGLSHQILDPSLAEKARSLGALIRVQTEVTSLSPKSDAQKFHQVHISTGERVEAENLIVATGRIPSFSPSPPQMIYKGYKAHFDMPLQEKQLTMFSFAGGYLGVSPIEGNKFNVACLVEQTNVPIASLIDSLPHLKEFFSQGTNLFDDWMQTSIPAFGIKKTPLWQDAYFIGDAALTVPPACGNGLSLALLAGQLAAEYAIKHEPEAFKAMWIKRCRSQLFWANQLHKVMMNPRLANPLILAANQFPYIKQRIYSLTRSGG